MDQAQHIAAHQHCIRHQAEILASEECGCFYCLSMFKPSEIRTWIREPGKPRRRTALCPECGIDSVIGSASGYPISREFLTRMQQHWFANSRSASTETGT